MNECTGDIYAKTVYELLEILS